ncbi:hypothetical protein CPC08DRAFT_711258 [Agrocybe pediades]|nr:hypothetical protein CPC08DRAFT_711258 [Agrocybe pediades]
MYPSETPLLTQQPFGLLFLLLSLLFARFRNDVSTDASRETFSTGRGQRQQASTERR